MQRHQKDPMAQNSAQDLAEKNEGKVDDLGITLTPQQIHNSDKSKRREVKKKIYKQLTLPRAERAKNMTKYWLEKLDKCESAGHLIKK